jgi:hypothetical protein
MVISANNVVIRNSRIHNTFEGGYPANVKDYFAVQFDWLNDRYKNLVIEDSELSGAEYCVALTNFTLIRVNAHGCAHEAQLGRNVLIQDSWLHDSNATPDAHVDVVQGTNCADIHIMHSVLVNPPTVNNQFAIVFFLDCRGGNLVQASWLDGGNFTVAGNTTDGSMLTLSNNRLGVRYHYGLADITTPFAQSGNVWDVSGLTRDHGGVTADTPAKL